MDLNSRTLGEALDEFHKQIYRQIGWDLFYVEQPLLDEPRPITLKGNHEVFDAVRHILGTSGLKYTFVRPSTISIHTPDSAPEPAVARSPQRPPTRTTTVTISAPRKPAAELAATPVEPAPWKSFTPSDLGFGQGLDGPSSVSKSLLMLNPASNVGTDADILGGAPALDLRGLGARYTEIRVNGRKVAGLSYGAVPRQADLTFVPLEGVCSIEIHPGATSGRSGGAIGGIIDFKLCPTEPGKTRISFQEQRLRGMNAAMRNLYISHTSELLDGRGTLSFWGSYWSQSPVRVKDWDFTTSGRNRIEYNNPQLHRQTLLPPLGSFINVRTIDGSPILPGSEHSNLFIHEGFDPHRDGVDALRANLGKFSTTLPETSQVSGGANANLRAETETRSANISSSFLITPKITAALDLMYGELRRRSDVSGADYGNLRGLTVPGSLLGNLFQTDVILTIPTNYADDVLVSENSIGRADTALDVELFKGWRAGLYYTWSMSSLTLSRPIMNIDPGALGIDLLQNPLPLSSLNAQRGTLKAEDVRTTLSDARVELTGPLFEMRSGLPVMLTLSAGRETERVAQDSAKEVLVPQGGSAVLQSILPEQKQEIDSAYAGIRIPLIGAPAVGDGDGDGVQRENILEAEVNVRAHRYRSVAALSPAPIGGIASPALESRSSVSADSWTAMVRFQPTPLFMIRAYCGTGFLAPAGAELTAPVEQLVGVPHIADPERGGEPLAAVRIKAGGNRNLQPEHARSCGGGFKLGSDTTGMRFSADYIWLRKTDGILPLTDRIFSDGTAFIEGFPERVERAPREEGDPYAVGRIVGLDGTLANLSSTEVRSVDLAFEYTVKPVSVGKLDFSLLATIQPDFITRLTSTSPERDDAGYGALAPTHYRIAAGLDYEIKSWRFGWVGRYVPHYKVSRDPLTIANQGGEYVSDQNFHDVYAAFTHKLRTPLDATLEVQIGARNVFRQNPSFDAAAANYVSRFGQDEIPGYYLKMRANF